MDTLAWEEPLTHRMKVERNLNFSTIANEEDEFGFSRKKTTRDPMSHRIIEKRRRDRMNNCLADLSRLVPTNYLKKGRGRIEKTEIIEMAIKHLKHLQNHPCKDPSNCEIAKTTELDHKRQYKAGYSECLNEAVRYITDSDIFSRENFAHRIAAHLSKHYDKMSGGMCYTQALGMTISEDTKTVIHMDVDNHSSSCFPPDTALKPTPRNGQMTTFSYEHRNSEVPELKQEVDINGHHPAPQPQTPVKATSQLREMLQNPGVPIKDSSRSSSQNCNGIPAPASPPASLPVSVMVPTDNHNEDAKHEEGYYKFKKNINHRFNNDLRHHTSSPTDSHLSDRMSLPDEDQNTKLHVPESYSLRASHQPHSPDERLVPNGLCNGTSNTGHAFSPYPSSRLSSELIVKIPERTFHENGVLSSSYGTQHWDSHAETASSCGSNPSPPPNAGRSNGSSSGYSTNGENNSGSTLLKPHNGTHSPTLSPYSRTPDRLSNGSPRPAQGGVPIFALHPKGAYYIPLTLDSSLLIPYMVGLDDLAPVLHPISICVNLSNNSVKVEKMNDSSVLPHRPQSSFIMNKYQERYVFPERPVFYPCLTSPPRNGCA